MSFKGLIFSIILLLFCNFTNAQERVEFARFGAGLYVEHEFKGISDWTPALNVRTSLEVDDLSLKDNSLFGVYRLGYRFLHYKESVQFWLYTVKFITDFNNKVVKKTYSLELRIFDTRFFKGGVEVDFYKSNVRPALYFALTPVSVKTKG